MTGNLTFYRARRDPVREERSSLRVNPVIDQRFYGAPKQVVDQDQARQELISHMIR